MLKKAAAILAALTATVLFTISASAYTLAGDFRPYANRDLQTAETLPPNEPLPVETKDGILVAAEKNGAGVFTNKHTGVTLTKSKVKLNGFTCTFRVDSMDKGVSYPAIMIAFTQNPGMYTWNVDMEGETLGNEGIGFFYRFRDGAAKDPYIEFNVAQKGKNIKAAGQSQSFTDKSIEVGAVITLKLEENSTYGYLAWINGKMLRVPQTDTPANLKGLRKMADKYSGQLYFNFSTQTQSVFGEQIKSTLMFVNGAKVSSKQTNTEPARAYEQLKNGKIVAPASETSSKTPSKTNNSQANNNSSKPNTTGTGSTNTDGASTDSTMTASNGSGDTMSDTGTDSVTDASKDANNPANASKSNKGGGNTGLIVALVIVGILVLGGGAAAAFFIFKK